MRKIFILLMITFTVSLFAGTNNDRTIITTGSLFEEMIDMTGLSSFPDPAYRTIQFSSYDHRSQIPGGPEWFANADGFGGEPIPNFEKVLKAPDENGVGEYLIADVDGPGAIVRLWTAWIVGTIRMYIDGSEKPVYDGPAQDFFQRPYDHFQQLKKIDAERFSNAVYQRDASYAPIPFAKNLRLVWIGNLKEIHFYHVQVRLYQETANVKSFSPADIVEYKNIIDHVSLVLSNPDKYIKAGSEEEPDNFEATLAPSEKKKVLRLEGSKALKIFTLRLQAKNLEKALRQTVLQIICDDYPWGQVQSPVGDFFGAAPGVNPYQSLPFTVRSDGTMICRFVMPFSKSLEIQLENFGDQEVTVQGSAQAVDYVWNNRTMHFRAKWRVTHNMIGPNEQILDLPFLLAYGKGVYVGTTSYLLNPSNVPTEYGNWWGEGDEKIFVDDDAVPSTFGTGSEDYYNYSWSSADIFFHPYCGQPRNDGPGNRGFVTNYRWHILDPIPFNNNIRFYMELFCHEVVPGLSYARTGYHYARPGMMDDCEPIMPEDLRDLQLPENWQPVGKKGSANSVFYTAEDIVTEKKDTRLDKGNLWEGSKVLVWTPKKNGDRKTFSIPVETTGKVKIYLTAALTPQSGKIAVMLNNKPAILSNDAELIDLYRPYRTLSRSFSLKPLELPEGKHTLTLEYKGAAENVSKPEIGIDFIWVQKINR